MINPWSRQGSGRPTAYPASSSMSRIDPYVGPDGKSYGLKLDPTLPPSSQAVVGFDGKRVAIVKRVGGRFSGDWDSHTEQFDSPHAAVRAYVAGISST